MDTVQELCLAFRTFRKNLSFTATSVATLALAVGASTAMFSVLNSVLLRPLPYRSPDQLAMLWTVTPGQNLRESRSGYRSIEEWRQQSQSFADIAVFEGVSVTLTREDKTERISVGRISPNFLPLLGVQPLHGRLFSVEEANQRSRVALISYRFWQSRFAAAPEAIGASIDLDGLSSRVIGILPPDLQGAGFGADVWEPHTLFPNWETLRGASGQGPWFAIGRLRPGVTLDQAQEEMSTIAPRINEQLPEAIRGAGIRVAPLDLYVVGSTSRLGLWMLAGAVLCVLLIAAVNVISLSLARGIDRAREMAIRIALGASPARIVRQLFFEGVTLGTLSGVFGSLLAAVVIRLVRVLGPADLARLNQVSLDMQALGWALAVSLLTGILVGMAPALTRLHRSAFKEGGRGVSGGMAASGLRRALVVGEFAIALVMLAGAGLLMRSWWAIDQIDPGFKPERVLSMQLSTTAFKTPAQRTDYYERVLEQVRSLPGVESAGIMSDLFISSFAEPILTLEQDTQTISERVQLRRDEVTGGLFSTIGTPLLRGRFFSSEDRANSPPVAIINDALARRLWAGRDPVGRRLKFGPMDSVAPWMTVVGVVADMRRQGLEREPIPQMFVPLAQDPSRLATLLVRTSANEPPKIAGTVEAAVRSVEKSVPIYGTTTLEDRLKAFLAQRRFQTSLVIAFSIVALLMASIGIYGLIQYSVAARTKEIGIRIAVGAQPGHIFRMTLREGLMLSLTGLAFGLVGALWIGKAVSSLLFGVSATDPLTFVMVSVSLPAVAVIACYLPARRAMKVEPVVALRQQ